MPETQANGRFSLDDSGVIFWQADATNPLPGIAIGNIAKGEALLTPSFTLSDASKNEAVADFMAIYVRQVLEPLFMLLQTEGEGALSGAALSIGQKLFDNLGVIHRSQLEDEIAALDADTRKALRSKGVRLGPVLVFLPALVKPAAVRLRAMLWAVWNGKTLPISLPADGRVSEMVDLEAVDRGFYRMIGYPIFGPRAIRIDMLDRVVTDIYDTAQKGVFEAKHRYAEWLGCGLDDLHAILESMGHRKMRETTAEQGAATEETAEAQVADESAKPETVEVAEGTNPEAAQPENEQTAIASEAEAVEVEVAAAEATEVSTGAPEAAKHQPVLQVQRFFLKRGKMSERPNANRSNTNRSRPNRSAAPRSAENNAAPAKKQNAYDPNKPQHKRDDKPRRPKGDKPNRTRDNQEARVFTFEGKKQDDANNPFAILKQLQK